MKTNCQQQQFSAKGLSFKTQYVLLSCS